jgi:hypothetical protein
MKVMRQPRRRVHEHDDEYEDEREHKLVHERGLRDD